MLFLFCFIIYHLFRYFKDRLSCCPAASDEDEKLKIRHAMAGRYNNRAQLIVHLRKKFFGRGLIYQVGDFLINQIPSTPY